MTALDGFGTSNMKTRIIHTKFWEDDYILKLDTKEKCLFNYYLTNASIGMTGVYEISPAMVCFFTGLTLDELNTFNGKFQEDEKIFFYENWVFIANSMRYQEFNSPTHKPAIERELGRMPEAVKEYFDTLSIGYDTLSIAPDTLNNHNKEIINNKNKEGVVKGKQIDDITEEELQQIAELYQVPIAFVHSKLDDLKNYCLSKGKRYKDYKATLRNWVKKDAMERRENGRSKIAYVGDPV